MIKEKSRKDIEEKYKWDLTYIYKNDADWYQDYDRITEELNEVEKWKNHIMDDAITLEKTLKHYFDLSRRLEKLFFYAFLNHEADTIDTEYQKMYEKIKNAFQVFDEKSTYITPEILKNNYDKVKEYMERNPRLKEYKNYLKETFRYQPHILSEQEENVLNALSKILQAPCNIYENLTDTDMQLGTIQDEDGNIVELSDRNYSKYISSQNREVRKTAFTTMHQAYQNFIHALTSTITSEIETNVTVAKLKKYESALAMSLFDDNITSDIYNNLITTVSEGLPALYHYYRLKKEILNLDEFHLYDLYPELIKESDKEYTFEEAKELVLDTVSIFGEEYHNIATSAFEERWIDVFSSKGKRSGAFSGGGYDTKPYILLNYQEKLNDVSTLAHELGHSMHSYFSRTNNTYQDHDYKIFVAEVASTVNELLLLMNLLKKSNDKDEKLSVLNQLMELLKGALYRQTMFAEFEKEMYQKIEQGEILTSKSLCDAYYNLNKKYFGPNVIVDSEIKYEWARIPHFYHFFYVYKYATGISAACYIVKRILNKEEHAVEDYIAFLKTGGRDYPIEELKIAGVDLTDKKVIESAIQMFEDTITQFEELLKQ